MKIGIDASRYGHAQSTGVENYSRHIIDGLLKLKNDDEIILYSREPLNLEGGKNVILPAKRFWTLRALSKEMQKNPPDVLFVPSHVLPLKRPLKSVITVHDVAFKHLRKSYSFFQYHYLNWSTKFAVKYASKIIVPSAATAKDLAHFYNCPQDKIAIVPHGFKAEKSPESPEILDYFGVNRETKYLLFVGRLESKKNLENMVSAFKKFLESHPDYLLILAGKRGVGFANILKTVNDLSLADKVIMPGYVTEAEKIFLYKNCEAFVFPSLYEGFGFPILEAFYYKKPVLSSHVSSIPEVAGEGAAYADPYDSQDIAEKLEKLLFDKEYKEKLLTAGKKQLEKFSWEKAAKLTMEVLKNTNGQ